MRAYKRPRKNKKPVWIYKKRIHQRNTISPPQKWWKELDGTIIDFWEYDDLAFVDIKTKKTIIAPKNYVHKQNLKAISREWCRLKWVKK